MKAVDFASLLCSRLCHDLMSPVGALNNGIELMADEQDPEMRDRCVELLADSAKATANKLKFFRRIATRYDKTARNFFSFVCFAAAAINVKLYSVNTT